MIKKPISLQDLRRKIYIKAKAEKEWKFWGLFVHICKMETLAEAYWQAKSNGGSPGNDGVTFDDIETKGKQKFLRDLQHELKHRTYKPGKYRNVEIPKQDNKGSRKLSIPTIKDRVVQTAIKLILEPIFEADFQQGSYGYRPKRNPHQAIKRMQIAILTGKTIVIDIDLKNYFNTIRHDILLQKIAKRVDDKQIMKIVKETLKMSGKIGVGQGSPLSPILANLYLNNIDKMLEKAKVVTSNGRYTNVEYVRFADDLTVLVSPHPKQKWVLNAIIKRIKEELQKIHVEVNVKKTKIVDLRKKNSKTIFLGFSFKRIKSRKGKWFPFVIPKMAARTKLLQKLKAIFKQHRSQPIHIIINKINPIIRGWVNYFRVGHSSKCFSFVDDWIRQKIQKHFQRSSKRSGFGWKRWSREYIYNTLGLYHNYKLIR